MKLVSKRLVVTCICGWKAKKDFTFDEFMTAKTGGLTMEKAMPRAMKHYKKYPKHRKGMHMRMISMW